MILNIYESGESKEKHLIFAEFNLQMQQNSD